MDNAKPRLVESFRCAFAGVWNTLRTQRNARIHLATATVVILIGLTLHLTAAEWSLITLTIAFVLVAEMFNSVMEAVVDMVTEEYHPLAKKAKDMAAGAVLTAAAAAIAVGLLILGPPLVARLR